MPRPRIYNRGRRGNFLNAAAQNVKTASEMLGDQTPQLRGQVDDFLGKIRAAQRAPAHSTKPAGCSGSGAGKAMIA
jgi:hypothetical protein